MTSGPLVDRIFFILSGIKDIHVILDEFEIRQDSTMDCGVSLSDWKMAVKCCEHSSTYIFDRIFFILLGNKDSHVILNEFEIRQDSTMDCGVSCP